MLLKLLFNQKSVYLKFIVIILLVVNLPLSYGSLSGIYTDNGEQTVIHRLLDHDDKIAAEHDILDVLGLADPPKHMHGHLSLRKSAPQFLLNVYQRLKEDDDDGISRVKRDTDEDDEDNFITDLDRKAIDQSDAIITFANKNHHVAEVRHEHGRRLWFDVSEVPDENVLMAAELRIFQNPNKSKWMGAGKKFVITVYSIIRTEDGQKELEILSVANTTSDYHGWLELNVTEGVSKWIENKKDNKGLYIGAHAVNKPEREIKLDDIGLVNKHGDDEYQPFMIGFFRGPELIKTSKHSSRSRRKRNIRRRKKSDLHNPLIDHHPMDNARSCQMETLYIDFKDLEWHDWIIAPQGYFASYCSGECNFPLNAHMNATNHAIVQTLVHLINPKMVPKPCCAPTTLGNLSVLSYTNEGSANLKKYKNMIVKSCGCH